ncbi:hypothetical protein AK812_SmicGene24116 [Symbiodinium microadriaticum]|uniref:Uncharacterized protein n=1 Tax=Symbiodinium microadriaticum TaxID=2951 RepID=A0A1Q9DFE8_SYMMI|nr:hypothetical protein AK812_SmicGene24116 [Symbiodinium microadriaticum]
MTRGAEPSSIEGRLAKQRRRLYDEQTAQVAVEVLAFRRTQEQMGLARLRLQYSNADSDQLFEIWRRHLAGEAVDSEGNPVQTHDAEIIEKDNEEGNKRLLDYLDLAFLSAKHGHEVLSPANATTTSIGAAWQTSMTTTTTPQANGTSPWIKTAGAYATFYFDSVWDDEKSRWMRRQVFRRKGRIVTNIPVKEWYALCSKVITFRRRHLSDQARDRNSSWKAMRDAIRRERPGESSSGVRREGRARILALTAHFVADMDKLDADHGGIRAVADFLDCARHRS